MNKGIFRPGAMIRRVHRRRIAVGVHYGPATALTMAAHPLWLAAFRQHEGWGDDAALTLLDIGIAHDDIVFGDEHAAREAGERMLAAYRPIAGRLERDAAGHQAGTEYDALDPEAQLWFLGCRYTVVVACAALGGWRLSSLQREYLWSDYRRLAVEALHVPAATLPRSVPELKTFMNEQLDHAHGLARERDVVMRAVFRPTSLRSVNRVHRATRGIVDPRVRAAWGLPWGREDEAWMRRYSRFVTAADLVVPRGPSASTYRRVARRLRVHGSTG